MKFTFSLSLPDMKLSDMKSVMSSKGSLEANAKANYKPDLSRNENKEGFNFVVLWAINMTIAAYNAGEVNLTNFNLTVSFKGFRASFEGLVEFLWNQVLSEKNITEVSKKILQDPKVLG